MVLNEAATLSTRCQISWNLRHRRNNAVARSATIIVVSPLHSRRDESPNRHPSPSLRTACGGFWTIPGPSTQSSIQQGGNESGSFPRNTSVTGLHHPDHRNPHFHDIGEALSPHNGGFVFDYQGIHTIKTHPHTGAVPLFETSGACPCSVPLARHVFPKRGYPIPVPSREYGTVPQSRASPLGQILAFSGGQIPAGYVVITTVPPRKEPGPPEDRGIVSLPGWVSGPST